MAVSNGVGPAWAPAIIRQALTWLSRLFFSQASWERHDIGYSAGGNAARRKECDLKFVRAMLLDAAALAVPWRMMAGSVLAWFFWVMVRAFGWTAFNYRAG